MNENGNKKKVGLIVLSLCLVGIVAIGVSYAWWRFTVMQTGENTAISQCLKIELSNESDAINLTNMYPITDEEGRKLTPYTFTLTNTCTVSAAYKLNMEMLEGTTLNSKYVAVTVNDGDINLLSSYDETTTVIDNSTESRTLDTGVLSPNGSKDYSVSIWMDKSVTLEDDAQNKVFKSKIVVNAEATETSPLDKIIASVDTTGKCPTVNDDGSVNVTAVEATNGYLCKAKDAYGDSYYYRGNVTNNYVKFGTWSNDAKDVVYGYYNESSLDPKEYSSLEECQNASSYNTNCTLISRAGKDMYWRIVRINGDGTVRVIYDGTSAHANGESSEDRQIGTSAFNSGYDDNAYVGYMYGATGASTYAAAHANTNDSTIKAYIDNWYKTNILGTANEQYLADNVFCNDRSISSNKPTSSYNNLGYGTNATAYRWYYGPWSSGGYNSSMKLICPQQNDAFTVSDTTNGNSALTYPVGLLSADEVVLAGGWNSNNSGYYLYSGQEWLAFSPDHGGGDTSVFTVDVDGNVNSNYGGYSLVRPVLNLKAEVLKNGDGTMNNPYRLVD